MKIKNKNNNHSIPLNSTDRTFFRLQRLDSAGALSY